ncbi:NHL repeat-containing 2-like [Octopus vulgaris]|uniref:NHL repeat-containing 2-like n=1 Tax=Octopus vulgaris TaxID=6645 RepID=A0AA36FAN0_OCTVU|nr:NHL repeat-containing 2-like [Octopus vulgaris]
MGSGQSTDSQSTDNSGSESNPGLLLLSDLMNEQYPIENLVFEGCGTKALAYVGAIKVLEKIDALPKIKRFAGVGTGAVVACLLAAGFDCYALRDSLKQHLENVLTANHYNKKGQVNELLNKFGWNSGNKFLDWLGTLLKEKYEDADITFRELYEKTGKELCIVVLNLNRRREEYFHCKTTPTTAIRRAVEMSISIPGLFQPFQFNTGKSRKNYYLDGGILCNYPIHCFDGWWLSMEPGKKVPHKYQPTSDLKTLIRERFSSYNSKTIGFALFDDSHSHGEVDIEMKLRLHQNKAVVPIPTTKLGRKYKADVENEDKLKDLFKSLPEATKKLEAALLKIKKSDSNLVSVVQLVKTLTGKESNFTQTDIEALFGIEKNEDQCSKLLKNVSTKEMIAIIDLLYFLDQTSRFLYKSNKRTSRTEVTNILSFWSAINGVAHGNGKLLKDNLKRTVGIYTGHVTGNYVKLEEADETYLFQQGWNSTVAFLRQLQKQ